MTRPALFILLSAFVLSPLTPVAAQELLWIRQTGSNGHESVSGMAMDISGNAYITGSTDGSFGGHSAGDSDIFLVKYDSSGTLIWTRQMGTPLDDSAIGVAVDNVGSAYVTGITRGILGGPNAGRYDAFLAKYDPSGSLLWTRQIGTNQIDFSTGVTVDGAGDVYIAGYTEGSLGGSSAGFSDIFLAKYGASGTLLWTRQTGTTANEFVYGVAADAAGNVYVTGQTEGNLGGTSAGNFDAFLVKYSAMGTLLWKRQIGTPWSDFSSAVAVDSAGSAYITGYTFGILGGSSAGDFDAFLAKYDASGTLLWTRQIGTASYDDAYGVTVDRESNAYITGKTKGNIGGSNAGDHDAFLAKYDAKGTLLWTSQTGTTDYDSGICIAVDAAGKAYIAGGTYGNLSGTSAGGDDVFLAKFAPPPCPADFNHDGFVTCDDFDSFALAFVSGDAAADFDHNGFVNGDDFDAYVAAFEAGC